MPKRVKHLWENITAYENLYAAFLKVRSGKRYQPSVLKLYYDLDETLYDLREQLLHKTWLPSPYRQFWVQERKSRLINAPAVIDRVVHWALMLHTGPVFEHRFITDSFACREGKGAHAASYRAREYIRAASVQWDKPYILKADIRKYFPSIDQSRLMQCVERCIGDADVLWLFETIIRNAGSGFGVGIPIGALTSQWLANLYLDTLDHFVKDDMGIRYYLRYMDDFVIVGPNKTWCQTALVQIDKFLTCNLRLALNPKTGIWPISQGLDFVGYRHWVGHILPRKSTVKRARLRLRKLKRQYAAGEIDLEYVRPRIASFTGYMGHCDGYRTLQYMLDDFVLTRP